MWLPTLILAPWAIYVAGVLLSLVVNGPSRSILIFGLVAAIGLVGGIRAIRNERFWKLVASIASSIFLALTLWRHAELVERFSHEHLSISATMNQYYLDSISDIHRHIEQQAFFPLFMYCYHEWAMPLLQVLVLLFVIRAWVQMRSNSSINTDAAR